MNTDDRREMVRRTASNMRSFVDEAEAYRNLLEGPVDHGDERSQLDIAESAKDQIRLYQMESEQIVREGGG